MGLLSGKYNDSPDQPPAGSRFAESNDKFSNMVRDSMYGNDEWRQTIAKVIKLKVCVERTIWLFVVAEQSLCLGFSRGRRD
jgi:hypothetical protein